MAKFRKKPVVIEAVQVKSVDYNAALPIHQAFDGLPFSEMPEWVSNAIPMFIRPHARGGTDYAQWDVSTLEGVVSVGPGDWIARGVEGEIYPIRDSILVLRAQAGHRLRME